MSCLVKDVEENKQGITLTLENDHIIHVKDYGFFFLSESVDEYDKARMVNVYERLLSELSQVNTETIQSLIPETKNDNSQSERISADIEHGNSGQLTLINNMLLRDFYKAVKIAFCIDLSVPVVLSSTLTQTIPLRRIRDEVSEQ